MTKSPTLHIILASESVRRIEILQQLGVTFKSEASQVIEGDPMAGERPGDYVQRLAARKVQAVAGRVAECIVIGADTVVVVGDKILGKPADDLEAASMLRSLSGARHQVITGLCLMDTSTGRCRTAAASTEVEFCPLDSAELSDYLATGEHLGKAGAYAIQGKASLFVRAIRGCYFNVVGFPVNLFYQLWKDLDLPCHELFFTR